jgi:hypothetical protein
MGLAGSAQVRIVIAAADFSRIRDADLGCFTFDRPVGHKLSRLARRSEGECQAIDRHDALDAGLGGEGSGHEFVPAARIRSEARRSERASDPGKLCAAIDHDFA